MARVAAPPWLASPPIHGPRRRPSMARVVAAHPWSKFAFLRDADAAPQVAVEAAVSVRLSAECRRLAAAEPRPRRLRPRSRQGLVP